MINSRYVLADIFRKGQCLIEQWNNLVLREKNEGHMSLQESSIRFAFWTLGLKKACFLALVCKCKITCLLKRSRTNVLLAVCCTQFKTSSGKWCMASIYWLVTKGICRKALTSYQLFFKRVYIVRFYFHASHTPVIWPCSPVVWLTAAGALCIC